MQNNDDLQFVAEWRMSELCVQHSINPVPIRLDVKGVNAGWANRSPGYIRLNPDLMRENLTEFIFQTIPHELCHIWDFQTAKGYSRPHGNRWKTFMQRMGVEPLRCHAMNTVAARKVPTPFVYTCSCDKHYFTNILHKRVQAGRWRKCRKCKQAVVYAGRRD